MGNIGRLPFPAKVNITSSNTSSLVDEAISLTRADSEGIETTYDFTAPPNWDIGLYSVYDRAAKLDRVECQIDRDIYRLYDISADDRAIIDNELSTSLVGDVIDEVNTPTPDEVDTLTLDNDDETAAPVSSGLTHTVLAARWIGYTAGIVLGRFVPGIEGTLGQGQFSLNIAAKLRTLLGGSGPLMCEGGPAGTLPAKVRRYHPTQPWRTGDGDRNGPHAACYR